MAKLFLGLGEGIPQPITATAKTVVSYMLVKNARL